jgi:hypothetical protein
LSDVLQILDELGIDYRVAGDEATALCPNPEHHDSSPSWSVNTESGLFNCFSCGYRGPLVRLVRDLKGLREDEAERWVRVMPMASRIRRGEPTVLLSRWNDRHQEPEEEAAPRITEASLWKFVPPPQRQLERRHISSDSAAALGILWDEEQHAWILPFRDADGTLHGWQVKETRGEKRVRNYPRGIKKSDFLFGLHAAAPGRGVLVESPLDVARLRTAGVKGGVSSYGVRVARVQLDFITARFDSLVIALDNDRAGWSESEKLRKGYRRLPVSFFDYGDSEAKDPGDLTDEEIRWGIKHAIPSIIARF